MNTDNASLYPNLQSALAAGVRPDRIVEVRGPAAAVKKVQQAVKMLTKNQLKRERRKARKGPSPC